MTTSAMPRKPIKATVATFALVFGITLAATVFWQKQAPIYGDVPPQVVTVQPPSATEAIPVPQQPPTVVAEPAPVEPVAPVRESGALPSVSTWIVYAGQEIQSERESISLPSGAKFAVKVESNFDGDLKIHTINPEGVSSQKPLWSSEIRENFPVLSPNLRLAGVRGLETLRIVIRPLSGNSEVERHIQMNHQ